MLQTRILQILFLFMLVFCFCQNKISKRKDAHQSEYVNNIEIYPGCYDLPKYFSKIKNKKIGLVIHPCSVIGESLLLDSLISLGIHIEKIFVPEHGFRGNEDAGENVNSSIDAKTRLPIISLYGKNKKPTAKDLEGIDIVLFDLQDVGARFYTYISSLHYIMEACTEQNKELIILDRPNPNGFYVDGPVLDTSCKSFIGMHPIPIVYGMTIGELARMIKGENWINNANELKLFVVPCMNYTHSSHYKLKIKPSPNLPNNLAVLLYPSLCLLEGTCASLGRGTELPFQIYGHPEFTQYDTIFMPRSMTGAKSPPLMDKICKGFSLTRRSEDSLMNQNKISLDYLLNSFKYLNARSDFFLENNFIDLLVGNKEFKNQIKANWSEENIRSSWNAKLDSFKLKRKQYLLYKDYY
ncbi:MAG: DUF1343 domain-containing protein [Saprospiraceae bacterium]